MKRYLAWDRVPRAVVVMALIAALFGCTLGISYALTVSTIHLAGVTILRYTDEARVEDIVIFNADTVLAIIAPTDSTQPDKIYTARLYLDGELTATAEVSWTADEITAGVKKWVFFTDLDLSDVTHIQVEVVG